MFYMLWVFFFNGFLVKLGMSVFFVGGVVVKVVVDLV